MDFLQAYSFNNIFIIILYFAIAIFFIILGKLFSDTFLSKKKTNNENNDIYLSFAPIVGIFIFGNILIGINFFSGLNNTVVYLFFLVLFFFSLIKNIKIILKFKIFFINISVLLISSTNIGISKDASLYHLQNQSWIRDEKIVMGLSNINPYLGYSSIFEYINSIFWLGNNFIFIHLISLYILGSLFEIVFKLIKSKSTYKNNIGYVFLIVGFLDNFGFGGGRNGFIFIQETFKYDHIFSALSLLSIILFLVLVNSDPDNTGTNLLLLICVFSLETRFIGHITLVLFALILFKKNYKINFKDNIYIYLIYLMFILKNIFYSSCIWFPIQFTCLDIFPWSQPKQAEYISKLVLNKNKLPNSKALDTISFNLFFEEFFNTQFQYVINFAITLIILLTIFRVFSKKILITIFQVFLSLSMFLMWFYFLPTYRFGVPFFLGIYFIMTYKHIKDTKISLFRNMIKTSSYLIYFFVLISLIRADSILELGNFKDINLSVEKKEIELIQVNETWWTNPENNSWSCGLYKYCYVEEFESSIKNFPNSSYFYFEPKNLFYYENQFS